MNVGATGEYGCGLCHSCYYVQHADYDFKVLVCSKRDNEPVRTIVECFEFLHFKDVV